MEAPYYGSPDLLREANRNTPSLTKLSDVEWLAKVDLYDGLVRELMLCQLRPHFRNLPAPANAMDSILSVMWMWLMTYYIQEWAYSTQATDAESAVGNNGKKSFDEMIDMLLGNRATIKGATRMGVLPAVRQSGNTQCVVASLNPAQTPVVLEDLFQHGLRR